MRREKPKQQPHHQYNRHWSKAQNKRNGWSPKPKGGTRKLTDAQQAERRQQLASAYPDTKKAKAKAAAAKRQFARYNGEHKKHKRYTGRKHYRQPVPPYGGTTGGYGSRGQRQPGWDNGDW